MPLPQRHYGPLFFLPFLSQTYGAAKVKMAKKKIGPLIYSFLGSLYGIMDAVCQRCASSSYQPCFMSPAPSSCHCQTGKRRQDISDLYRQSRFCCCLSCWLSCLFTLSPDSIRLTRPVCRPAITCSCTPLYGPELLQGAYRYPQRGT